MSTNSKWNNNRLLWIAFLVFWASAGYGQVIQIGRFEVPISSESPPYSVISAQTEGLILYRHRAGNTTDILEIVRLDTALTEVWRGFVEINQNLTLRFATTSQNFFYILFQNQMDAKANFFLIRVDLQSKDYTIDNIKNLIWFNPTNFMANGDAVMVGGYFNYRPLILHYSIATKKSKILPGSFNEPGEILQIKPSDNGTVDVIVNGRSNGRKKCLWIRNYDTEGNLIKTTLLEPEADKSLIFGRSIKMPGDEQVVAGVYGKGSEYSRGIFVAHINTSGEYKIRYYSFGDLENFFKFMKGKREKRIKERIQRRKIRGKKIKFNYRFLVHEIIPYGDQYVMLGEAFYPEYRTTGVGGINFPGGLNPGGSVYRNPGVSPFQPFGPTYGYNALLQRRSRSDLIFNGYQYTHAVVIGFSWNGDLLWDNSFEINDIKSFELEQFVKIQPHENHISLLYLFENSIRSKIIKDSKVLEGKTTEEIKTEFAGDQTKKIHDELNKLEYWYPGHFYAYGVQEIKNLEKAGIPLTREVFFINKITNK